MDSVLLQLAAVGDVDAPIGAVAIGALVVTGISLAAVCACPVQRTTPMLLHHPLSSSTSVLLLLVFVDWLPQIRPVVCLTPPCVIDGLKGGFEESEKIQARDAKLFNSKKRK